jgi:hypothetical protein
MPAQHTRSGGDNASRAALEAAMYVHPINAS